MEHFKLNIDWSAELSAIQNKNDLFGYCDLTLQCSDGYIKCHKALISNFRHAGYVPNEVAQFDSLLSSLNEGGTDSELKLATWSLKLVSKVVFILYFGEALISKKESRQLQPILEMFQINSTKRLLHSKKVTRANPNAATRYSDLIKRKVLAARKINDKEVEEIHIYGDGSEMAIPPVSDASFTENAVFYDENGAILCDPHKLFCHPCSIIFCDRSDYISHTNECGNNEPRLSPPKVIKIEPGFIKMEIIDNAYTENIHDAVTPIEEAAGLLGSIKVCLICVQTCGDISDFIIHSHGVHGISPNKDYDLGAWKCKRCDLIEKSGHMPIFLQHVFHCKKGLQTGQKASRKRAGSNIEANSRDVPNPSEKRKRRKIVGNVTNIYNETTSVVEQSSTIEADEEPGSLSRLVISNVSTIQPGTSLDKSMDKNYQQDVIKCTNSMSTVENETPEVVTKSEKIGTPADRELQQSSTFCEATFLHKPLNSFTIPKIKAPNQINAVVAYCSESTLQHFVGNGESEITQSLVRSPRTFTGASYNNPPHLFTNHKINGQSKAKFSYAERIKNQISNSPLQPNATIARAPPPPNTTLINIFNTVANVQSQINNLSNTINTKPNHIQRQPLGLPVKWSKKKTLFNKFGPKVQLTPWSCRRCSKAFTTQQLYMHHSC